MISQLGRPELHAAMGQCRWHFVSVAVFSVFVNLLMLTGPLFMLQIYDRVLTSRSEATLVALLVLVTALFAMMGVLEFIRGRVLARAGARFQSLLDSRVMIAVLRRAVQPDERARPNTAARDLEAVRQLLSGPAPFALFDMPWAPIFIAVIFLFHPFLGWISVFGAVILVGLTLLNQIRSSEPSAESQRATAEADNLGEAMRQNAEAVQGLGMRGVGIGRWIRLRQEALHRQITASDRTAGFTASSKSLRFYLQSVILAAGAWLVLQQEISAGMMIAASIMLGRALAPVEQAIGQWSLAQRAARGWKALVEMLARTPPEIQKTALPAPKGHVDVQGVTVAAPGENYPVLRAISFKASPGMAIGVIGPSGAGKTTLAKVLTGIWRPVAGKVRIDGAALDQWPEDALGQHLGYLPQEIGLMSGSVAENIARMSEQRDDQAVVDAAQRAGAHDLLLTLPQGYDTQIGAGGQRLSGGQRQRVALARALYGDPPVLILDEPNANLDAAGEQALVDAIREAKERGKTVIVMAHRPSAIAACDMLLMIDKGVQIDYGPRDEVLKKRTKNYAQLPGGAQAPVSPATGVTAGRARMSAAPGAAASARPAAATQGLPGQVQRHNVEIGRIGDAGTSEPSAGVGKDSAGDAPAANVPATNAPATNAPISGKAASKDAPQSAPIDARLSAKRAAGSSVSDGDAASDKPKTAGDSSRPATTTAKAPADPGAAAHAKAPADLKPRSGPAAEKVSGKGPTTNREVSEVHSRYFSVFAPRDRTTEPAPKPADEMAAQTPKPTGQKAEPTAKSTEENAEPRPLPADPQLKLAAAKSRPKTAAGEKS